MKKMMIAIMLILTITTTANAGQKYKATGYWPNGYKSAAEAKMEGGPIDCQGQKLRTMQEYKEGSYISVAVDPRRIKLGSIFYIAEMPNKVFLACDRGSMIRGNKIDICVASKKDAYVLPDKITVIKLEDLVGETKIATSKIKKSKKVAML